MRGFTMVELIVVMAVMAILAALAVPLLTEPSALQERGAREQVRGMLRHARQIAMTQQRDVCVLAAPAQARAVYAFGACAPASPLAAPGGGPYVVDMPAGVALGGAPLVRFNARGQLVPAIDQVFFVGASALSVSRETGFAQ